MTFRRLSRSIPNSSNLQQTCENSPRLRPPIATAAPHHLRARVPCVLLPQRLAISKLCRSRARGLASGARARARGRTEAFPLFAWRRLPFRRPKWEHLGMPAPKGAKPTPKASSAHCNSAKKAQRAKPSGGKGKAANDDAADGKAPPAKKRSKPKVEACSNGMNVDGDNGSADATAGGAAKPRARKGDAQGGGSKKRPKKQEGDDARHGGIGGLLDDDEDSADRRAVENLIEAARGKTTRAPQAPDSGGRKANGGKRADKAASNGAGGDWDGGGAGLGVGSAGHYGSAAASLLGSLGLGNLQLPAPDAAGCRLQLQLQEYHEMRKRMDQQVC